MSKTILYLIVFLLPAYLVRFHILFVPTTLLEVLIYIALIVKFFEARNLVWLKSRYNIPIILIIVAGLISSVISPDKMIAFGILKGFIIDPVILYLLVKDLGKDEKLKILKLFTLSGIYVSLHAIWQHFSGNFTIDGRVVGLFGYSPNYLAMYLAPILICALALFIDEIKQKNRLWIIYIITFGLCFWALILASSRAAIIGAILGLIFYFILLYWSKVKRNKLFWLGLVLAGIVAIILGYEILGPKTYTNSIGNGRIAASSNSRLEIWKTTFEIIKQKPIFGVGLGNYQNYFTELTKNRVNYPEYISPWALTPHNVFLTFWVNLGILGEIALIWILVIFFKDKQSYKNPIIVAVIFSIIINGLFEATIWKNDLSAIFWLIVAL